MTARLGALALAVLVTFPATVQAAEVTTLWQRSFERETDAWIHDVALAPDGGYCLVGRIVKRLNEEGEEDPDAWVLRLDAGGDVVWDRSFGGEGDQGVSSAVATADGGCVVTGGKGKYIGDAWIFRLDRRGEMVWEHLIGGPHSESIGPIAATPDGGFVALGSTWDPHDRWFDRDSRWLVRFDANGAMHWQRAPGDPTIGHRLLDDNDRDVLRGSKQIAVLENGHVLIAGPFSLSGAELGYAGIELDDSGSIVWSETLDPGWPHAFAATPGLGYVIGYFEDVPGSSPRAELTRYDARGRELWRTQAPLFDDTPPPSAFLTRHGTLNLFSDGSLTMLVERDFRTVGPENPDSLGDLWLLRFNAEGQLTTRERLPASRTELARPYVSAALVERESLLIVGKTVWGWAGGEGLADVWLRRISLP